MKNSDLLDDDAFNVYEKALSKEDLNTLDGKIPYSIIRGENCAELCALFEQHDIDYALQPQPATTNGTGIIPLTAMQYNLVNTLIYIDKEKKEEADKLVDIFERQLSIQPTIKTSFPKWFYVPIVLFIVTMLWLVFYSN